MVTSGLHIQMCAYTCIYVQLYPHEPMYTSYIHIHKIRWIFIEGGLNINFSTWICTHMHTRISRPLCPHVNTGTLVQYTLPLLRVSRKSSLSSLCNEQEQTFKPGHFSPDLSFHPLNKASLRVHSLFGRPRKSSLLRLNLFLSGGNSD